MSQLCFFLHCFSFTAAYFNTLTVVSMVVVSVSRRTSVSSYLGLVSRKILSVSAGRRLSLVLVSAICVSCPRPIFGLIVQATVRSVNGL